MQKILVVDDSTVSRMLVRQFLQEQADDEFEIIEADSGETALEIATEHSHIDRALLDYNMPGINGIELAAQIQDVIDIKKSALLTANIQDSARQQADELGLTFFGKPITSEIIRKFIEL